MNEPAWQLTSPVDRVIFDCDGTLTAIEGIDALAEYNGVGTQVKDLTHEAMGVTGINPDIYQRRLTLVKPSKDQLDQLSRDYISHQTPDILPVIQLLQRHHKSIHILSAGLRPAIEPFADALHIPRDHVIAVDMTFDENGQFSDYDRHSPLLHQSGKQEILSKIGGRIIYIGDGLNDCMTSSVVTRFIGYGGVFFRDNIASLCHFYLKNPSMAPIINLSLTREELKNLNQEERLLCQKGKEIIENDGVVII